MTTEKRSLASQANAKWDEIYPTQKKEKIVRQTNLEKFLVQISELRISKELRNFFVTQNVPNSFVFVDSFETIKNNCPNELKSQLFDLKYKIKNSYKNENVVSCLTKLKVKCANIITNLELELRLLIYKLKVAKNILKEEFIKQQIFGIECLGKKHKFQLLRYLL